MSTPSITAPPIDDRPAGPAHRRGTPDHALGERARTALRRLVRGREADPAWSRPLLWLVGLLAGALTLWGLTRNGYANIYYAEAAQAASRSWTAWLTNAVDTSGLESLDKGPLSNMAMGLSGRLLGFSSFSMLLPEALCGIASVLLLHNVVRRTLGHRAALLAALMLALTPIFVAMSRFNNPDPLLVLCEIAAAWALVRALESGRTRHLLLCGLFIGLAFNVKMLAAYLIVPGLALAFLIAGKGSLRRRVAQLAAGAGAMLAVSFAWYGAMMLIPAAHRPFVGDTTDNSWFSLIFGANGLSRVAGNGAGGGAGGAPGGAGGFGGAAGLTRLFNPIVGGQISWLLPLALTGLLLGLWARRRAPRTDAARSAYILWGGWGVVSWAIFSFSEGIFHPYYTTALAPAVAVLAAGGLVELWDRARRAAMWAAALGAVTIGTAVWAAVLLARAGGFVPWLAPTAIVLAALAGGALVLARVESLRRPHAPSLRVLLPFAAVAGLLGVLAGPASYAIATVGDTLSGGNPLAGPASANATFAAEPAFEALRGGPGGQLPIQPPSGFAPPGGVAQGPPAGVGLTGGGPGGAGPAGASGSGLPPGALAGGVARSGGLTGAGGAASAAGANVSGAVIKYLEAHQDSAKYMVAAVGSNTAGAIALRSGRNVIDMGGFMGADPAPTLAQVEHLIDTGQLHYVLLGGQGGGPGGSIATGAPGGAGPRVPGGGGPGGSGAGNATIETRDRWIEAHGTVVHVPGQSASGSGATLYHFAR
ncbi:MAG TPA: glycosyltransferase family 39 protein [Solirubrobacteraceae bacterium]|jgi:4-amino-4-deoxy-L-arabinose transferase-like glycosyltransferase|nr:glycosyltransferase family 39 protein [Solirubrobacteraceae bacterium]